MLGVIIPAHNEEKNIEKVIDNVLACGVEPLHIFVIDNNSTDRPKILSETKNVNVYEVKRLGYQVALREGLALLDKKQYSQFCIVDGDNEIGESSVAKALAKASTYDLVVGRRPHVKRMGEIIVNRVMKSLYGVDDLMCGVKSGSLHIYNKENALEYGIDLFLLKKLKIERVYNFDIELNPREETKLGNLFMVNIKLIINLIRFFT